MSLLTGEACRSTDSAQDLQCRTPAYSSVVLRMVLVSIQSSIVRSYGRPSSTICNQPRLKEDSSNADIPLD